MTAFFHLTHPEYEDDFHSERTNPVWIEPRYEIPTIVCPDGRHSVSRGRIRIPLPSDEVLAQFKDVQHLPLDIWLEERPRWAALLGVDIERITASAPIGPPEGLLNGMPSTDFIFPSLDIWVRTRVKARLEAAGCTGIEFAKAEFIYRGPAPFQFCDGCDAGYDPIALESLPEYWEITVTGTGWREGQYDPDALRYQPCTSRRRQFAPFKDVKIDESHWDRSDFFNLDAHPGYIIVTDRVRVALEELGATNYVCEPLP